MKCKVHSNPYGMTKLPNKATNTPGIYLSVEDGTITITWLRGDILNRIIIRPNLTPIAIGGQGAVWIGSTLPQWVRCPDNELTLTFTQGE